MLTKDNNQPEQGSIEVGGMIQYQELGDRREAYRTGDADAWWVVPRVRLGLLDELTAYAEVPFGRIKPDVGDEEKGFGDVAVGLEWMIFEDIFDYPWLMVHAEERLDTGDEDDGLGSGEKVTRIGLTLGSTMWEVVDLALETRYRIYEDAENVASIAFSAVWEVSEKLALVGEAEVSDQGAYSVDDSSHPALFMGGFTYRVSDALDVGFYGGGGKNRREDVIATMRAAYTF